MSGRFESVVGPQPKKIVPKAAAHPDCEDRCQLLEHKGYHTCAHTGRCEQLAAAPVGNGVDGAAVTPIDPESPLFKSLLKSADRDDFERDYDPDYARQDWESRHGAVDNHSMSRDERLDSPQHTPYSNLGRK